MGYLRFMIRAARYDRLLVGASVIAFWGAVIGGGYAAYEASILGPVVTAILNVFFGLCLFALGLEMSADRPTNGRFWANWAIVTGTAALIAAILWL